MVMSQTNTKPNNGQNQNQISRRGRWGQGPGGRGHGDHCNDCGNNQITNEYSLKGKMKDGSISKLIITKTRHQPTQYKKIINTLLVLCADKNHGDINDIIQTGTNLVEANFTPPYPDTNRWSTIHKMKIVNVNPNNQPDANTSLRRPTVTMARQTSILNPNF